MNWINCTLHWINTNAGAVNAILTFVYVISTIIIVYYNRISIKEIQMTRKLQTMPDVNVSIETEKKAVYFVIRNTGNSTAYKINIKISKDFIDSLPEQYGKLYESFASNYLGAPEKVIVSD